MQDISGFSRTRVKIKNSVPMPIVTVMLTFKAACLCLCNIVFAFFVFRLLDVIDAYERQIQTLQKELQFYK